MRPAAVYTAILLSLGLSSVLMGQTQPQSDNGDGRSLRVSDQLVVNYFESDPQQYETHLVITDVEGAGSVVNVLVYDDHGDLLDQESYFLPIFGKVNYNPADRLKNRKFRGTIRIVSDGGNVAAQYWQFYRDPDKRPFNTAIPVSDGEGGTALMCQHFVSDPRIDAKLVLSNPSSDSASIVASTFYLDNGKQLSRERDTIPPNGSIMINPFKATEGLVRTGLVYCEVLSGGKITGEYWQLSSFEKYQVSLPLEVIPKRQRDW